MQPFLPPRTLGNGHTQTLIGAFSPGEAVPYTAQRHLVNLGDGDQLVLHDDCPEAWRPGDRMALLVHGLAGSHLSPYSVRIAGKLVQRGVRAFRVDLRGCGAGLALAKSPYHAGRSADIAASLDCMRSLAGVEAGSPIALVGFSLGGNMVLKLAGELGDQPTRGLEQVIAVNPPVDLARCVRTLTRFPNQIYDQYFVKLLWQQVREKKRLRPDSPPLPERKPRTLFGFDDAYTAPAGGFDNAEHYYAESSASRVMDRICVPTTILTAANDPLVPHDQYQRWLGSRDPFDIRSTEDLPFRLFLTRSGGHLGYFGRYGTDPDRRWMDWRLVEWIINGPPHTPSLAPSHEVGTQSHR